jgi:hypothetical protein
MQKNEPEIICYIQLICKGANLQNELEIIYYIQLIGAAAKTGNAKK